MDEQQVQDQTQEQAQVPQYEPENESLTNDQPEQEVQEQVSEEPTPEAEPEATVEDASIVEEEEDDSYQPFTGYEQNVQTPQIDLSQVPANEDGTLNAEALAQQINSQLAAANQRAQEARNLVLEMEEKRREEQLWHKAQDKFPELKSDKQLAQEVQALRMGMLMSEVNSGNANAKLLSPAQAYDRLQKRFASAKAEGVKQGTENVKVQESAYIEPANAGTRESADKDDLFRRMRSGNRSESEKATNDYLDSILFG